jgi:putative glutamine amidotransferase
VTITVGLTDDGVNEGKYALYEEWLREIFDTRFSVGSPAATGRLEMVRLTPGGGNGALAARCDGIVLTGGGDVDPQLYGGDPGHPTLYGVSRARDQFETDTLTSAIASGRPVLGICRGMQLANVALGGTLITHLDGPGYLTHRPEKGGRCEHSVRLAGGTGLQRLLGVEEGDVVSSHHQAVGNIGGGLRVAATSRDGVVEALESDDGAEILLIQWHPERAAGRRQPLCAGPGILFFQSISSKRQQNGNFI